MDLFEVGLTAELMKKQPAVRASVWVRGTGPNFADTCFVRVKLLDSNHQVVQEWNTGDVTTVSLQNNILPS